MCQAVPVSMCVYACVYVSVCMQALTSVQKIQCKLRMMWILKQCLIGEKGLIRERTTECETDRAAEWVRRLHC